MTSVPLEARGGAYSIEVLLQFLVGQVDAKLFKTAPGAAKQAQCTRVTRNEPSSAEKENENKEKK